MEEQPVVVSQMRSLRVRSSTSMCLDTLPFFLDGRIQTCRFQGLSWRELKSGFQRPTLIGRMNARPGPSRPAQR